MKTDEIREHLKIVTGVVKPAPGVTIHDALKRLDEISKEEGLSADLAHYLSRRSYMKALEWLDHPDMPHRR